MSSGILIDVKVLRSCLEDLRPMFGKGNNLIPVLFKVKGNTLTVCCTSGCVYVNKLPITNESGISTELTAQYRNILDFLPKLGIVNLAIESYGLVISGEGTQIQLPVGYSIITEPESYNVSFIDVDARTFPVGINSLLNIGLSGIYKVEKPFNIYGNISVIKYPNVIAQARTPGLSVGVTLTQDYAKLLSKFNPDKVYSNGVDSLVLKRDSATLELPAEPLKEENDFLKYMEGLSVPIRLNVEHYVDRLRNMNNLGNNVRAKITIFDDGVRVTAEQDNVSIAYDLGDCSGKLQRVFYLPMLLYMSVVKALGNTTVEFLYGKEILCLRSPSLIIIARAIV